MIFNSQIVTNFIFEKIPLINFSGFFFNAKDVF